MRRAFSLLLLFLLLGLALGAMGCRRDLGCARARSLRGHAAEFSRTLSRAERATLPEERSEAWAQVCKLVWAGLFEDYLAIRKCVLPIYTGADEKECVIPAMIRAPVNGAFVSLERMSNFTNKACDADGEPDAYDFELIRGELKELREHGRKVLRAACAGDP